MVAHLAPWQLLAQHVGQRRLQSLPSELDPQGCEKASGNTGGAMYHFPPCILLGVPLQGEVSGKAGCRAEM